MFRFGILCVQSMVRIRRLKLTPEPLSIMVARRDPYRMKAVRKVRKRFNPLHSFSIWFFNVYRSFFLLLDLKGNRCLCFPSLRSLGQERWGSESSCPLWTPPENRIEASLFIKSQSEPTVTCVFPYILPLTDVPVVYAFRLQLSCIVAIDCITVLYYISPPLSVWIDSSPFHPILTSITNKMIFVTLRSTISFVILTAIILRPVVYVLLTNQCRSETQLYCVFVNCKIQILFIFSE